MSDDAADETDEDEGAAVTYLLIDGENLDATLGSSLLGRRPAPPQARSDRSWRPIRQAPTNRDHGSAGHGALALVPHVAPGRTGRQTGPPMVQLRRLRTAAASVDLLAEIRQLLDAAFDGDFSDGDWEHTLGGWHIVATDDHVVVAHAAVVERRFHVADRAWGTGYLEGVTTEPRRHGEGLGSQVMAEATSLVRERFELGALSTGRHRFYKRLGWERWRGPTFVRGDDGLIRTEDEDDGVMVLRAGPSCDIELTSPIACEARRGDDW